MEASLKKLNIIFKKMSYRTLKNINYLYHYLTDIAVASIVNLSKDFTQLKKNLRGFYKMPLMLGM